MAMTEVRGSGLESVADDKSADRRTRLREFQSQLLERMQVAREHASVNVSQLAVVIGDTNYLLNLHESGEIVSTAQIGQISRVPLTQDWYLGLLNIRGNLIGVVDMQLFQGQGAQELTQDSRIVGFSPALGFNCGLLVSRVLGLRTISEMNLKEVSAISTENWLEQNYLDGNNQRWVELNLSNLIQNIHFLQIGL